MKEFKSINKLTDSFQRLPGIGHRTAEKMAYQVLEMNDETVKYFSDALSKRPILIKYKYLSILYVNYVTGM